MRKTIVILMLAALCCTSCQPMPQKKVYNGSVKVVRSNADVTRIDVELPGQTLTLNNREEAETLLLHLEALTAELKLAKDQFKVQETAPAKGK